MQLLLSRETEELIQRHLATGQFASAEDVVRAAIAHFDEYAGTVDDLRASFEDEQAGRIHALRDVDSELRQKYGIPRRP